MAERKRLAIKFDVGYKYSSGATIYFINIINALNTLPDNKKPDVYIVYSAIAPVDDIKATGYAYLHLIPIKPLAAPLRMINRLYRNLFVTKKFTLFNTKSTPVLMDAAFSLCIPCDDLNKKKQFIWYADLQTHHHPQNYSAMEIKKTAENEIRNLKAGYPVVLSSQWCVDDFYSIYPNYPHPVKRLRFAPTHPNFSGISFAALKNKFTIAQPYFIVSNQYWIHKNHIAVFKAIKLLKDKGVQVLCLCTGSPVVASANGKDYVEGLLRFVKENGLEKNIQFLGFIQREEQLCLMQNSLAIIQPSFFESWNTTVEDAKALNKFIIVSGLKIHREQLDSNCAFFDPTSEEALAVIMQNCLQQPPQMVLKDYKKNIEQFGQDILEVFELN
jgi:glycosyltransferase involved in cell wall biosynthesis